MAERGFQGYRMMRRTKAVGTIARMWCDSNSSKFTDSLAELLIYEHCKLPIGEYIHYDKATASWHELGRNQIVEKTLGDWLFMLDTDHAFAPDLLERLFRLKHKYNAPVISAIYQYKFPPHSPVVNLWQETEAGTKVLPVTDWDRSSDILQVGPVGAGSLLVDKAVLRRMQRELGENPFTIIPGLSEDYSFCYRCKKLGIPVLLAPQVECHHLVTSVLSVRDYAATGGDTVNVTNHEGYAVVQEPSA